LAAVRYLWMFRTAAVVHLFFGLAAAWRFGLTEYDPAHRWWGVGLGVLGVIVGVFLFKPAKFAMALSAIGCAVIAICAAVAAPIMQGAVILAFASVAIVFGLYAAFAARVLFERPT
jgi:FtsH-binding integral membrane protein